MKDNAIWPPFNEYPPVPTFEMLHRFMLRDPPIDVAFETTSELIVAVPVVVSAPETVTLDPAAGTNTRLEVAEI